MKIIYNYDADFQVVLIKSGTRGWIFVRDSVSQRSESHLAFIFLNFKFTKNESYYRFQQALPVCRFIQKYV